MSYDSLGDRMKTYERAAVASLPIRMPIIIRIDGKAFHTYTRDCIKPFDVALNQVMNTTAQQLCSEVQGTQLAYVQSDEISLLVHNYKRFNSSAWFDNKLMKMVSVAAGIASSTFTANSGQIWSKGMLKAAVFDARAFVLPEAEVCNYFVWRQQDAIRNSVQMLARSKFSHKQCDNKSCEELKQMMPGSWEAMPSDLQRGRCIIRESYSPEPAALRTRWIVDNRIPVFTEQRDYINQHLKVEEE